MVKNIDLLHFTTPNRIKQAITQSSPLKTSILSFFFFFGCVGSSLLLTGFLQLWRMGATLRCSVRPSHCGGFSYCRARAPGTWAPVFAAHGLSSCGSQALERRLSSCGAQAQLLRGMWDLPGPGLYPMSLVLAGGFFSTAPPGESQNKYSFGS